MVSTFTPNIQLEEPARGDDVGTWDTPVNNNSTLIDLVSGAITTISLNNSNVILSAAQFQSNGITFNSTLTGSVTITFPTSFKKPYYIRNMCTGSSAFTVTLATTATGGQVICCPPGESIDVVNDGTNLYFHNLERVGTYWDYAGSSVPAWISGCTIPPYLNCSGGTFSATTYPQLAVILGSTTLPDTRGRSRAALNQGAARINAGGSGIDGNTIFSAGGNELLQAHSHGITDPGHSHGLEEGNTATNTLQGLVLPATFLLGATSPGAPVQTNTTGITVNSAGSGASQNMPPTYIGGLTLIRAA